MTLSTILFVNIAITQWHQQPVITPRVMIQYLFMLVEIEEVSQSDTHVNVNSLLVVSHWQR